MVPDIKNIFRALKIMKHYPSMLGLSRVMRSKIKSEKKVHNPDSDEQTVDLLLADVQPGDNIVRQIDTYIIS